MGNTLKRKHVEFPELKTTAIPYDDISAILAQFPLNELRTSQRRSLFVTGSMRTLYAELKGNEGGWTRVLKGASGAGKSTALLFMGHIALSSGCIVFSLKAHEMLRNNVHESTQKILNRWLTAVGTNLLSEIWCPLIDGMNLLDVVRTGARDPSKSISSLRRLIFNLCSVIVVPVVILIDQYNAFHSYHSEDPGVLEICEFFSSIDQLAVERGCILRAYSASFSAMPLCKDGDSLLNFQISPMDSSAFAQFVQTLTESYRPAFSIDADALFSLCAGLPREAVSIFFLIAQNPNDSFEAIRFKYFNSRTLFYEYRIRKLTNNRHMSDALRDESVLFAARLFIGERMDKVPSLWEEAGLIVLKDTYMCVPCEAAERGLIKSFCQDTAKAAISIYHSDASIRWRSLELAFVFVVRQCIFAGNPVTFECTDLKGQSLSTLRCSVDTIFHYSNTLRPSSIAKGTLLVCPRGTAVVDFVLYGKDGTKVYIQVSECAYVDHSSNIDDIPKVDDFFQDALIQDSAERLVDMQYLYITTSEKLLRTSTKYNEKVLLIGNGADQRASRFFRNLI